MEGGGLLSPLSILYFNIFQLSVTVSYKNARVEGGKGRRGDEKRMHCMCWGRDMGSKGGG